MRNPDLMNKVDNIYKDGGKTILKLPSMEYFDKTQYDFLDDKEFKKFMKELESTVRHSFEYRELIRFLKTTEGMDECSFLENVSSRDNTKVHIEIHHEPFTLFDICLAVFKKRQDKKEDLSIAAIAEEVLYLHYLGWVGLIPLSETIHTLVHNQYLFIPLDKVRGNYRAFRESYYNYIEPDTLDYLDACELATTEYNGSQMDILNRHEIYIDCEGSYNIPRRDDIINLVKGRIDIIKGSKKEMIRHI